MFLVAMPGCAAVLPWHVDWDSPTAEAEAENPDHHQGTGEKKNAPGKKDTSQAPPAKNSTGKQTPAGEQPASARDELEQVLDRLQRQGQLSPQQRKKLAQDLALVDRSAWPILIQYFLASAQWAEGAGKASARDDSPPDRPAPSGKGWPGKPAASPVPQGPAVPASRVPGTPSDKSAGNPAGVPGPQAVLPAATATPGQTAPAAGPTPAKAAATPGPVKDAASAGKGASSSPDQAASRGKQPAGSPAPQEQLQRLIATLETQVQGPARSLEELQRHVYLRMLYLAAGQREKALEPIPGIPAPQQQYWTNQFYALSVYLDGETIPHSARRATEAKVHLDQAVYHLGASGNLVVKNLALCTAVRSFGVISRFEKEEFRPGQVVLLYAELENFSVEETPEGYLTTLRGSYQIYDARGNQVASEELPVVEDKCRNRRRDFFVSYRIQLPQRIYPGPHKLQLTIEDAASQRMATGTLEFTVAK